MSVLSTIHKYVSTQSLSVKITLTLIPDSALSDAIIAHHPQSAIIGADAIDCNGFVSNKMGSRMVALGCKYPPPSALMPRTPTESATSSRRRQRQAVTSAYLDRVQLYHSQARFPGQRIKSTCGRPRFAPVALGICVSYRGFIADDRSCLAHWIAVFGCCGIL